MKELVSNDMIFALGRRGPARPMSRWRRRWRSSSPAPSSGCSCRAGAVEAGEKLGFLPGDMKEKVDPYLRPLYDALHDCLPAEQVERRIASGEIEIAPIAFMRGGRWRTPS